MRLLTVFITFLLIANASASALDDDLGSDQETFLNAALCAGYAMIVDNRDLAYAHISLMKMSAPDRVRTMGKADRALWIGEWAAEGERQFKKLYRAGKLTVNGDQKEWIRACKYMANEFYKMAPTETSNKNKTVPQRVQYCVQKPPISPRVFAVFPAAYDYCRQIGGKLVKTKAEARRYGYIGW